MHTKYQRGELSLFWASVLVAVVTLAALAALFSMRYERNFFAEAWQRIVHADAGQSLRRATEQAARPGVAVIRKCIVNGKVTYSNVECDSRNLASTKPELHDSQGIEPPKTAPAPQADAPGTLQEKMMEKAMQR